MARGFHYAKRSGQWSHCGREGTVMDLRQLGFEFWERNIGPIQMDEGCVPARVIAVDRGQCAVHDGIREVSAEPSGRLCYAVDDPAELPCVGDYVAIRRYNGGSAAIIEKVLPRRTFLRRRAAGSVSRVQMIAANVDVAFIVQACGYDFNPNRLERALVLALEGECSLRRFSPRLTSRNQPNSRRC
jgi:ribosome biogenesis GTPase